MKQCVKVMFSVLLLAALCGCGSYESRVEGTWQGDGSLKMDLYGVEGPAPFDGVEQWVFDGDSTAIATVNGRDVELHYYITDDTLTLNDGGEVSWGVRYELKGSTLRILEAEFTKVN